MRRYIIAAAIAIPLLLVAFIAAGYASDEVLGDDRSSRGVSAAGMDLSRMSRSHAETLIADYEATLSGESVVVLVEGNELALKPSDAGFSIDEDAVVSYAMAVRRADGLTANVRRWFGTFASGVDVEIPSSIDEEALAAILDDWTETVLAAPAYQGDVNITDGRATAEYPRAGVRIDVPAAISLIEEQIGQPDRAPVVLPLVPLEPEITRQDVDNAVQLANELIGTPVLLSSPHRPAPMLFTTAGLATAFRSKIVRNSPAVLEVSLDATTLRDIASRTAEVFVVAPAEATFTFDEETRELTVVPSEVGKVVDLERVPEVVAAAALGSGRADMPMKDGAEAELTTEMAEAMGPLGEVSTFTTYHPCCANRVTNIQLLADEINGAIVGEGYVRAGAIISGEVKCCDSAVNIGGGTSQFATTFYNAVFFGCYEDVLHQPHSLYFSRYPYVREATLGFPLPDVIFKNDSDAIVYIHTEHTGGSITVTLYGNNGGRTCTSERSGNTVTRVMEHANGAVTTQSWSWNYRAKKPKTPATTTTVATETTITAPPPEETTTTAPPPEETTTTAPPPEETTTTADNSDS